MGIYETIIYGVINLTNKNITLSVWNKNSEKISVVQGEVDSRFINLTLMDLISPLDLTNKTVTFLAKKPDNTVIFNHAEILDAAKGLIQIQLTSQICAIPGTLSNCEIHIIDSDSSTLIVKGIDIEVLASLGEAVEKSISEYTAYEQLTGSLSNHISNNDNPHNVTAAQVNALPNDTKYGFSLAASGTALSLKDQNGTVLNTISTQDTTYTAGANISISASNAISATDTTYTTATSSTDGLMSSKDKSKLDGIISNASVISVQSDWNVNDSNAADYIKNKPAIPTELTDLTGTLPITQGGTGAKTAQNAITNLGGIPVYTSINSFISYPCTMSELIQAMPNPATLMVGIDLASNSITDLPCSYGILTIHKRAGSRVQVLYNRSYEGTANGNYLFFGNYNTNSKSLTWNKIFTNHIGCQIPIENGGTGAKTASDALGNLGAQALTDNTLKTTNKTIVGAINELYDMINNL